MLLYLVLALLFALLIAIFSIQNYQPVEVRFLSWEFTTSLAAVILGAVGLGVIFTVVVSLVERVRSGLKIRRYKGQIEELEKKLSSRGEEVAQD